MSQPRKKHKSVHELKPPANLLNESKSEVSLLKDVASDLLKLPTEVLELIFSDLNHRDLINLTLTCKRFYQIVISYQPCYSKCSLNLVPGKPYQSSLLTKFSYVKALLNSNRKFDSVSIGAQTCYKELMTILIIMNRFGEDVKEIYMKLQIEMNNVDENWMHYEEFAVFKIKKPTFWEVLALLPNLEIASLFLERKRNSYHGTFYPEHEQQYDKLPQFEKLRELNIFGIKYAENFKIEDIVGVFANATDLNCIKTDGFLENFVMRQANLKSLQFSLDNINLTERPIRNADIKFQLETISFRSSDEFEVCEESMNFLKSMPLIKDFTFHGCDEEYKVLTHILSLNDLIKLDIKLLQEDYEPINLQMDVFQKVYPKIERLSIKIEAIDRESNDWKLSDFLVFIKLFPNVKELHLEIISNDIVIIDLSHFENLESVSLKISDSFNILKFPELLKVATHVVHHIKLDKLQILPAALKKFAKLHQNVQTLNLHKCDINKKTIEIVSMEWKHLKKVEIYMKTKQDFLGGKRFWKFNMAALNCFKNNSYYLKELKLLVLEDEYKKFYEKIYHSPAKFNINFLRFEYVRLEEFSREDVFY